MRPFLFNVAFYVLSFGCAVAAALAARMAGQAQVRAVLSWWSRRVLWLVRVALGGRIEVRGQEKLPAEGAHLIVAKHQSELDAILLFSLFPNMTAIVMQELERYPFVGRIIKALDMIAVAVDSGPQGRTATVIDGATRALADGRPVLIYPEGTLMSLGAKERYRHGAWRIYNATGATVFPVAQSLGAIWPRREWRKRVGRTGSVAFLDPMPPGLDADVFMEELERRIETATMALIRENADGEDLAAAEDRYARGVANED